MKNIYFLILFSLFSILAFSQTEKGNIYLGGSINYHFHQQDDPDGSQHTGYKFAIYPRVGYIFAEKWLAGTELTFAFTESESHQTQTTSTSDGYGANIFLRRYISMGDKTAFFAHFYGGVLKGSSDMANTKNSYTNYTIGLRPGFHLSLTPKLALEAQAGFLGYISGESTRNDEVTRHKNFYAQFNPASFNLGLYFFL